MGAILSKISGWKTYVIGIAAVLTAIGAWMGGTLDAKSAVEAIWAAIMAMTIRHGITTTVSDATGKTL